MSLETIEALSRELSANTIIRELNMNGLYRTKNLVSKKQKKFWVLLGRKQDRSRRNKENKWGIENKHNIDKVIFRQLDAQLFMKDNI